LGILVAVVVRNVQNRVPQARVAVVKTQIREFESALDEYKMDNGQYPTTEQGLQALVTKPTSGQIPSKYPEEGYMKRIPKDPWGNDYVYIFRPSAKNPIEIISFGRDGKEGGEGEDKDLINYEALAQ
jgi:general secretion pathway protein G